MTTKKLFLSFRLMGAENAYFVSSYEDNFVPNNVEICIWIQTPLIPEKKKLQN